MANFANLDLPTTLQDSARMVACARVLAVHVDQCSSLPHRNVYHHITNYMIGELEKCGEAAFRPQIARLASATRNLFELSLEKMALRLLLKANGYTAECIRHVATKCGLPGDPPIPKGV